MQFHPCARVCVCVCAYLSCCLATCGSCAVLQLSPCAVLLSSPSITTVACVRVRAHVRRYPLPCPRRAAFPPPPLPLLTCSPYTHAYMRFGRTSAPSPLPPLHCLCPSFPSLLFLPPSHDASFLLSALDLRFPSSYPLRRGAQERKKRQEKAARVLSATSTPLLCPLFTPSTR